MDYVVVAGIDPFFMEETQETARLCVKHKVPYVTIDCHHTDYLHQNSAINVVSKECLSEHYKGIKKEEVFEKLISTTDGLVIITTGQNDMIFGRKSTGIHYMPVFKTDAKSTLGAGDTFKAGIYLEDLYVIPEYRGCGYGKGLIKILGKIAKERGCGRLEWWCLDWNISSIDFYLSLGAEPMKDWTVYRITGQTLDALAED